MANRIEIILTAKDFASKGLAGVGKTFATLGRASVKLGATLAGVSAIFFKVSNDFNKAMANVATLIPGNIARVEELKKSVQSLAVEVGKSTADLSEGLFQVVSAFGDTADTVEKLRITAKAATAGMASTTEALNLLSAVTKGYGDTTSVATQKAADLAFMTNKLGQTTFPELAASIGRVVPLAAQLGIKQEELFAGFATLTGVTGNAAEVSTQLAAIMRAAIKPTEGMKDAVEELGFSSASAVFKQLGMVKGMEALIGTTDGSEVAIGKLFSRVEGLTALFALTGAQADTFSSKLGEMQNATGAMTEAFEAQTTGIDRLGFKWRQLKQQAIVVMQDIGDTVAPVFETLIDNSKVMLTNFGTVFKQLPAIISAVMDTVRDITIKALVDPQTFRTILNGFIVLGGAILDLWGELFKNMGAIVLKLGAVIFLPLASAMTVAGENIKFAWQIIIDTIVKNAIDSFIGLIQKINSIPILPDIDISGLQNFRAAIEESVVTLPRTFDEVMKENGLIVAGMVASITDNFTNMADAIRDKMLVVRGVMAETAESPELAAMFTKIEELLATSTEQINEFSENLKETLPAAVEETSNQVKTIWSEMSQFIEGNLIKIKDVAADTWLSFQQGIGDAVANSIVFGENLGQSFKALMKNITASVISALVQMGVQRLAQFVLSQILGIKEATSRIGILASETFAGAFAATALIPIIGPIIAPGVASASLATMLAGTAAAGAAGAATGAGIAGVAHDGLGFVPREGTFLLDKGERVLSPNQNKDLTGFLNGGGGAPVIINKVSILEGASIDEALTEKPMAFWEGLAREKILPALNTLGDFGSTTTLKQRDSIL